MNYYPHHIGDFDRATRHLTRIERSIYRDLLDVYYDSELPLTLDQVALCRKVLARSPDEVEAVRAILVEFFHETPDGWYHDRCEEELETYRKTNTQKSVAGKASAAARAARREQAINGNATGVPTTVPTAVGTAVQRAFNGTPTNQEPITNNQKPETNPQFGQGPNDDVPPAEAPPAKKLHGNADDHKAARWMFEWVVKVNPTQRAPSWDAWANDVRLMREIDGRTHAEMCELFLWAKKDSFWCANIQSPAKLRKKWDVLAARRSGNVAVVGGVAAAPQMALASVQRSTTEEAKRLLGWSDEDDEGRTIDAA